MQMKKLRINEGEETSADSQSPAQDGLEAGSAAPYGSQPRAALITKASSPLWECKTKKLLENLAPLFGRFLLLT